MKMERMNSAKAKLVAVTLAAVVAMPIAAQQTTPGGTSTATGTTSMTPADRDNDRDWGWIGLLGLVGLAGLMRRKDAGDVPGQRTTAAPMR